MLDRTVIAALTFVDVLLARIAFPTDLAEAFAAIEIAHALAVVTDDVGAHVVERAVVDLHVVELVDLNSIDERGVLDEQIAIERHVEIAAEQNVFQAAAKAVADGQLDGLIEYEDVLIDGEVHCIGEIVIEH